MAESSHFSRRLICLSPQAEAQLDFASRVMRLNHSMVLREALRLYVARILQAESERYTGNGERSASEFVCQPLPVEVQDNEA
jgi:hypothetical protein